MFDKIKFTSLIALTTDDSMLETIKIQLDNMLCPQFIFTNPKLSVIEEAGKVLNKQVKSVICCVYYTELILA